MRLRTLDEKLYAHLTRTFAILSMRLAKLESKQRTYSKGLSKWREYDRRIEMARVDLDINNQLRDAVLQRIDKANKRDMLKSRA